MDKRAQDSKRLIYLATKVFKENPEGAEFLELLKKFHIETPTFPVEVRRIERHGGAIGWASFREGNLDMIRKLELMANSKDYLRDIEDNK